MKEQVLCGICEKQIDSDASTLKAAGLEWIIQVNEDIKDGLARQNTQKKHHQFQFMQDINVVIQYFQQ